MSFPSDLPDNIDALKAMLVAAEAQISTQDQALADRDAIIERKEDRIIRLEKLLSDFKRALYGAKSEKGDPDQYHLALEDIETAMAVVHAEDEAIDPPKTARVTKSPKGRGVLPKHLPRVEEVIAPDSTTCGCGAERHIIGEDISERLDIVPAQFRVIHCPAVHVYMHERGHTPPQICLSVLRGRYCASTRQTAPNRRRHAHGGGHRQRHRVEVC